MKVDFSMVVPIPIGDLFHILTDFPKLKEIAPDQVKECKILQQSNDEIITEEILTFNTYFKNQKIHQKTSHKILEPHKIINSVIEGPFKGSMLEITLEEKDQESMIIMVGKCKTSLKYAILRSIIEKYYKSASISLLYKIINNYISNKDSK